jgi:hypothetical protein
MRFVGKFSVLAFCVLAVQLVRCGGEPDEGVGNVVLPERIVYDGKASDEAIERVWDKRDEWQAVAGAPVLVSPSGGAVVPAGEAPTLRWEQELTLAPPAPREAPLHRGNRQFPQPISIGVQPAWAHLPPVFGWVYLVELRPASGETLWLFSDQLRWSPDPVSWQHLVKGGEITVRITSAYLNANVVEEGPWLGEERTFRIGEG